MSDYNVAEIVKGCKECKLLKDISKFPKSKTNRDKHSNFCGSCTYQKNKVSVNSFKVKHPEKYKLAQKKYRDSLGFESLKSKRLRTVYKITFEDYNQMYIKQNGLCAICEREITLHSRNTCIDHNHETDAVRSLLCRWCNSGIGFFEDNTESLLKAIAYLKKHG